MMSSASPSGVPYWLSHLVAQLGGHMLGADVAISRIAPVETALPTDIAFISHPKYAKLLTQTQAGALIVPAAMADAAQARGSCIVTPDAYHYFALLTQWWKRQTQPKPASSIHATAVVDAGAVVADDVTLGPFVHVQSGARIGQGAVLGSHCVIGHNAVVGAHSRLAARVTLGDDCQVGERCIVHSGVVIGADGFGFARHDQHWVKIEQLGAVRIGNDVEIGANSCIDRGALDDTVIENGVKIDNLVQIGHNVHIGAHSALAGCAGVAGSAHIGAHCTVGGGAVVLGHLTLADGVHISAASVVTRSLHQPGQYTGVFPLDTNAAWEKNAVTLKQLHALRDRVRKLDGLKRNDQDEVRLA
jgi:UDP-3-O-[3-hydroxymyristoyl] glucosamine N-acyltransferase